MKAVVISGAGRYSDPWHDFAGTSAQLAVELSELGLDAEVLTLGEADVPSTAVDLLVVNAGGGSTPRPVEVSAEELPSTSGLTEQLSVVDERYCDLRVAGDVTVLVDQEEDGRRHPIVWARAAGGVRVVHDALGHDAAAYRSPDRRALLGREVDWLLQR